MLRDGEAWRLVLGDCRAHVDSLPAEWAVVTDPPYGMGCNTNSRRFTGGVRPGHRKDRGRDDWPEIDGDAEPFDPTPWLRFSRVILWGANHYAARLPVGTTLVWIKKADHLFGTFLSDAELAWMKGGHGVYCFRKQFPPPSRMREGGGRCLHPAQKPVDLMKWCLSFVPPEVVVVDPYAGSGTTLLACLLTGRRCLGFESNPAYHAVAVKRLAEAANSAPLFDAAPTQGQLFGPP